MPLNWGKIEEKWRRRWEEARIFECDPDQKRRKFFITVAYPYPNSPQHIGHGRTYTLADAHARYKRMKGFNVLFPMAFHYTGTPILAMSKRLREGDEDLIKTFSSIYHVPEDRIEEFVEPIKIARYFHEEIKNGMRRMGYSIDWRREFTTIDPQYSRFIEWQFHKLRERGYITQGSHPVGWCPNCGNPVGQHDTKGDVEPEIEEFTIIKFKLIPEGSILPTATLRPETVFGVTNIWINPESQYVKLLVDGEVWIVSSDAVAKLKYIKGNMKVLEEFSGESIIGSWAENPIKGETIPIFPADFVDPKNATGVVMSVPGHAPFDYIALDNLKRSESVIERFKLKSEEVRSVKAVSLISLPGYGEIPAHDIVTKVGIKDQLDPRLEEATRTLYRQEYRFGRMKGNTGSYSGLPVSEAREKIKARLMEEGSGDLMHELSNKPIFCRCGAEVVVKIFEDQWFINYGDPKWKEMAHQCIKNMEILPEEMRHEFGNVIDWLREKACARRSGLGTKLPWDKRWIIESLSDSVIYMAYYVISNIINEYEVQPENLSDSLLDFVFLGKGEPESVASDSGLNPDVVKMMRRDFSYFYPLDSRHSGRDLVPNHLSFMIFIHTAIFPRTLWPRQIAINGSVLMEGQKMSKSLGNIIPLRRAIPMLGADPLRLTVLGTAELLQDADFSMKVARTMMERLERLHRFVSKFTENLDEAEESSLGYIDRWILSRLQNHIRDATEAMDGLMVRRAINIALYLLDRDLQWYLRRVRSEDSSSPIPKDKTEIVRQILDSQIRMLTPVTPHICEELWEVMGNEGFVSLAEWPKVDERLIDVKVEEIENLFMNTLEDTQNILKAIGISSKKVVYYVAAPWKWRVHMIMVKRSLEEELELGPLIKICTKIAKRSGREMVAFIKRALEELNKLPKEKKERLLALSAEDERNVLQESKDFLKRELKAEVEIYGEEEENIYDPAGRAKLAKPLRPAIYIE